MAMGRDQKSLATSAAVVATVILATAVVIHRHRHGLKNAKQQQPPQNSRQLQTQQGASSWLTQSKISRFPVDEAAIFELRGIDRSPSGQVGGAGALRCSDTKLCLPISALDAVPGLVLYSVELHQGEMTGEEFLLVFVQVPSVPELFEAPFLDRGVRALMEIGSKVLVARLDAVENQADFLGVDKRPPWEQARCSIIWNTGRCGSTLMHKLLQKVGVLSFSEPYWMEKISELPYLGVDGDTVGRVFGVCASVDLLLARKSLPAHAPVFGSASTLGSGHVSFNPKGKSYAIMEPIMKAMPDAVHLLMYRDAREVVESFASIFSKPPSLLDKVLGFVLPWRERTPSRKKPQLRKGANTPVFSSAMAQAAAVGRTDEFSDALVQGIACNWMETMCLWKEIRQLGFPKGTRVATLRMKELVHRNPEVIEDILRFVLDDGVEVGEDAVALALEVFEKHSQAGDPMEMSSFSKKGAKKKFLTPLDEREISDFTASVPVIGSPSYIFPDSIGAFADYRVL